MATKKTKKPAAKRTTAAATKKEAATTKPMVSKKADAEFDKIMEEMKREAAKEEAKKTNKKQGRGSGWTAFWVLLGLVLVVILGGLIFNMVQDSKVKKSLPELINYLGGGEMNFKEITSFKKEDGVYKFEFTFEEYPDEPFTSYISKKGKTFFVSGYDVAELKAEISAGGATANGTDPAAIAASCESINKSATPELTAFIVADCPYGTQMQTVMVDAISQAPELESNFKVRYFFDDIQEGSLEINAMHGPEEAQENLRQICIREEQSDVFWDYVACYAGGTVSDTCLTQAGVNATTLNTCMTDTSKGIAYALEDNTLAELHNVSGSPTLVINDTEQVSESAFGGRNANGLKSIVCCSADNALPFCDASLTTEVAAANGNC